MAPMRDEEERSGYTPAWARDPEATLLGIFRYRLPPGLSERPTLEDWWNSFFESYGWLWPLHKATTVLFVFALLSFLLHAFDWLFLTEVFVPSGL
jgi:hypothetical protein